MTLPPHAKRAFCCDLCLQLCQHERWWRATVSRCYRILGMNIGQWLMGPRADWHAHFYLRQGSASTFSYLMCMSAITYQEIWLLLSAHFDATCVCYCASMRGGGGQLCRATSGYLEWILDNGWWVHRERIDTQIWLIKQSDWRQRNGSGSARVSWECPVSNVISPFFISRQRMKKLAECWTGAIWLRSRIFFNPSLLWWFAYVACFASHSKHDWKPVDWS